MDFCLCNIGPWDRLGAFGLSFLKPQQEAFGVLREDAFPVGLVRACRVEDKIGGRNERRRRIFETALSLVDDGGIKTLGIGGGLFGDLRLELASLNIDPGSVQSRSAASFGGGGFDLDAEFLLREKAPPGTLLHREPRQPVDVVLAV